MKTSHKIRIKNIDFFLSIKITSSLATMNLIAEISVLLNVIIYLCNAIDAAIVGTPNDSNKPGALASCNDKVEVGSPAWFKILKLSLLNN